MKITHQLGLAGWIATTRGKGGGIRMTLEPRDIALGAVVRTMEPDFFIVDCFSAASTCSLAGNCKLRASWTVRCEASCSTWTSTRWPTCCPQRPRRRTAMSSTSGAPRGRARPDAAHRHRCIALALGGYASAAWLTHDFQVWTAEGARRLEVALQPIAAPPVQIDGPGLAAQPLPQLLADGQSVTLVDFVYTRCQTVCLSLGSVYQQMQTTLQAARTSDASRCAREAAVDQLRRQPDNPQESAAPTRAPARRPAAVAFRSRRRRPADTPRLLADFQVIGRAGRSGRFRAQRRAAGGRPARTAGSRSSTMRSSSSRSTTRATWRTPGFDHDPTGAALARLASGLAGLALLRCWRCCRCATGAGSQHDPRTCWCSFPCLPSCGFLVRRGAAAQAGARRLTLERLRHRRLVRQRPDRWRMLMIPRVLDLALVDGRIRTGQVAGPACVRRGRAPVVAACRLAGAGLFSGQRAAHDGVVGPAVPGFAGAPVQRLPAGRPGAAGPDAGRPCGGDRPRLVAQLALAYAPGRRRRAAARRFDEPHDGAPAPTSQVAAPAATARLQRRPARARARTATPGWRAARAAARRHREPPEPGHTDS